MHKHDNDVGVVQLPKIAPHLRVNVVQMNPSVSEKWLLITSEHDKNNYQTYPISELGEIVFSSIDGKTQATQIIQKISAASNYAHEEIVGLLSLLSDSGIVISGKYDMDDGQAALWLNLGFTPALVESVLRGFQAAVVNHSRSPGDRELAAALNGFGVRTSEADAADLTVVMVDDYLKDSLEPINREFLEKKIKWLPVKLSGNTHWAGPVFNRGEDAKGSPEKPYMAQNFCWYCLAERIAHGRQIEQGLYRQTGIKPAPAPAMDTSSMRASGYAVALEIAKYILYSEQGNPGDSRFCSSLRVWNLLTNEADWHIVNKNPACAVCENANPDEPQPVVLDGPEVGQRYVSSGWRIISPERTFENCRHLNNPYTGVVDLLEEVENRADDFCFVSESGNNIATQSDSVFMSLMSIRMRNAGKGITPATARTGALCEAIERYSTSLHGNEIRKSARYCDFSPGEALMPNCFMNFSDRQFEQRSWGNLGAAGNPFVNIPDRLREDEYCEWSPIWSVTHRRTVWTPSQLLYYGYPYAGRWIAIPDTNGVAAGNSRPEAFVQAFLEVLERDAISLWWNNQLRCHALALDSVDIPFVRGIVEQYENQGRHCWVLDISFDLGVNIFVFLSRKKSSEASGEEICLGCSAHFDPEIALTRAICEHAQLWAMIESRREKDFFKELSPAFVAWLKDATTRNQSLGYLLPLGEKKWSEYRQKPEFNLLQQRQACFDMVEDKGWELYLAEFTRPSVGLPVIRVMIPQLRNMHRRLGPGRLYNAPVEIGLLEKAKTEAEMNRIDIFI